jgi:hypothetical protein
MICGRPGAAVSTAAPELIGMFLGNGLPLSHGTLRRRQRRLPVRDFSGPGRVGDRLDMFGKPTMHSI